MSRKVTEQVVAAFLQGSPRTVGSTHTDGTCLYLHGNKIAEHDGIKAGRHRIKVTLAGWNTSTIRERLNGLPGVQVSTKKGQAYLNGEPWDGSWTKINY